MFLLLEVVGKVMPHMIILFWSSCRVYVQIWCEVSFHESTRVDEQVSTPRNPHSCANTVNYHQTFHTAVLAQQIYKHFAINALMSEDLPAPGGPVTPRVRHEPRKSRTATDSLVPTAVWFSIAVMARATASVSPRRQASSSAAASITLGTMLKKVPGTRETAARTWRPYRPAVRRRG